MSSKNVLLVAGVIILIAAACYSLVFRISFSQKDTAAQDLDPAPQTATLSGTYVCLPHLDTTGPQTEECAFGLKTDDGAYYAVNFGASANSMEQFQSGTHIQANGFVVIKEALNSDHWAKYNMKGIFTITEIIDPAPTKPVVPKTNTQTIQTAPGDHPEVDHPANEGVDTSRPTTKSSIVWKFSEAPAKGEMPQTAVVVIVNGKSHTVGTYNGSCNEIGASGGIDGKGLLAGELSAVQCWYAGGGDEIGVFAVEDGTLDVMVGGLSEGEEGSPMFRGDFSIRSDIKL